MTAKDVVADQLFRVWLVAASGWQPADWDAIPPRATVQELATECCLTVRQASAFVEGFNREVLRHAVDAPIWAVALPVRARYDGDVEPGAAIYNGWPPQVVARQAADTRSRDRRGPASRAAPLRRRAHLAPRSAV